MPAQRPFTPSQYVTLREVVVRHKKKKTQADLAKSLELTQPSLSKLLSGEYRPGIPIARHIADLEGLSLEELLPGFVDKKKKGKPHLEIAASYHEGKWPAWAVAAARESPLDDVGPEEWAPIIEAIRLALAPIVLKKQPK